jgi:hypothetical protein
MAEIFLDTRKISEKEWPAFIIGRYGLDTSLAKLRRLEFIHSERRNAFRIEADPDIYAEAHRLLDVAEVQYIVDQKKQII